MTKVARFACVRSASSIRVFLWFVRDENVNSLTDGCMAKA